MIKGKEIIDFNIQFYNLLIKNPAFNSNSINNRLVALRAVALFCSAFHTGRFNSGFCNDRIKEIAKLTHEPPKVTKVTKDTKDTVLFIATSLYITGGHTRLMENIADFEKSQGKKIKLIITEQVKSQVPLRILQSSIFNEVICLGSQSRIKSVNVLRNYIRNCDKIYNNQDPYDPVPPVAFETSERPYTIYINHADHVFWLGAQQSDTILHIRPYGEQLSKHRRSAVSNNIILPIRINTHLSSISKTTARQQLNIPEDSNVLLTISSHYKLIPNDKYNLFEIIDTLITHDPRLTYFLIGITLNEYKALSGKEPPSQVQALGVVEDPTIYKLAANYYIEGMPVVSLTALLDGVFAGAYPFLIWKPYYACSVSEADYSLDGLVNHPADKNEYLMQVSAALMSNKKQTYLKVVKEIQNRIVYYSSNDYWASILNKLGTLHSIKEDTFLELSYSNDDITLAEMLYNAHTDKRPIEFYILNVMYSSLSYLMYIKVALLVNRLTNNPAIYKATLQQLTKKTIRQFFPFVANRFSKRIY